MLRFNVHTAVKILVLRLPSSNVVYRPFGVKYTFFRKYGVYCNHIENGLLTFGLLSCRLSVYYLSWKYCACLQHPSILL